MMLDPNVVKARGVAQTNHLLGFETPQNRKRAVVTDQTIFENKFSQRRVKQIRHRIAMQIDHENSPLGHAVHLTQNAHNLFVDEVMREERTHHVSKLVVSKWQFERVTTH
jgi:hypothetical protein